MISQPDRESKGEGEQGRKFCPIPEHPLTLSV
jgi:hypothetical protein